MDINIDTGTFDRYNNPADKVRCPYGRAKVRDQIDGYTKAAVNLYGVISREELVNIFNKQNTDQTDTEEIYILLLPLVLKGRPYGFYKNYIVHETFFYNFSDVESLIADQGDKPRYIPKQKQFLKYANEYYRDERDMSKLKEVMLKLFGNSLDTINAFNLLSAYLKFGRGVSELWSVLEDYNLKFEEESHIQELMDSIMEIMNSERIWENKGHSPIEIRTMMNKLSKAQNKNNTGPNFTSKKKVGRNEPCPCGSGKKYKKCCGMYDHNQKAKLTKSEMDLFYETWMGLLAYVNERKKLFNPKYIILDSSANHQDYIYEIRNALWQEPDLISEYIEAEELLQEKIDLLIGWRDHHIKSMFFVLNYQAEYAIFLGSDEEVEDIYYGVKGITDPISTTMQRQLPYSIQTVLLPFKGKIIYDSFIETNEFSFGPNITKHLEEASVKAQSSDIITSLD